jgi:hypothetical protein
MRKFHVARAAVAALILVLMASAFAPRTAARATVATAAVATAAPGPALPGQPISLAGGHPSPAMSSASNSSMIDSTNWAGYAVARPGAVFRYVQATFFVPYVDCVGTPNAYSSHWVGLDGLNSRTVEQLGVEAGCSGTTPQYYAWYEMYPGNEASAFFVKPGNSIVASVYYNEHTKMFLLTLLDTTTGQHFSHSLKCTATSCTRASAQIISESPADSSGQALPLADYRASSFSGISVTDSLGHRGTLSSSRWNTYEIIQINSSANTVAAQPTSLFRGTAFNDYWFRET